ncbi:MAG: nicotinate phosphoribosyltransferase [Planctomycetes bacterium]|nr:nicotinate phosphoribosyltransferase [Planctomycetota bacterium]
MGASYFALGLEGIATFSLFVRRLPASRCYLVAAGLDDGLNRLVSLRFDNKALDYLRSTGVIREDFIDALADFRFTGDVRAVPEGRVVFAEEPLLEVRAPIMHAQLAETLLINALHFPTLVATKAARCISVARGRSLVEFGLRRTPSIDAGVAVARAAYLAGFDATSNLLAGEQCDIPVSGTVAHSFIELFPREIDAFRAFGRTFPGPVTLLIDTYDTVQGARHAAQAAKELQADGGRVQAVRLDSGDLASLSREVRAIFDAEGLRDVRILASGGLDEHDLQALLRTDPPIDAFGIGTRLGTSHDAPSLDMVYKLVEYDGTPRLKLSEGKATLIGPKQVWRNSSSDGYFQQDLIAMESEPAPGPDWEPLLEVVMSGGNVVQRPSLEERRSAHRGEMQRLPESLRALDSHSAYQVHVSSALQEAQRAATEAVRLREGL